MLCDLHVIPLGSILHGLDFGVPPSPSLKLWQVGYKPRLTMLEGLDLVHRYLVPQCDNMAFYMLSLLWGHVDFHLQGWILASDSEVTILLLASAGRLEFAKLHLCRRRP